MLIALIYSRCKMKVPEVFENVAVAELDMINSFGNVKGILNRLSVKD